MDKLLKRLLSALEAAGIKVEGDQLSSLKDEFAGASPSDFGLVELEDGQTVISESVLEDHRKDFRRHRERIRDLESSNRRLEESASGGDDKLKRDLAKAQEKITALEPLTEQLSKMAMTEWQRRASHIPVDSEKLTDEQKALRNLFRFPEEGKQLEIGDVLTNLTEYDKLQKVGVFATEGSDRPATIVPRTKVNGNEPADVEEAWRKFHSKPTGAQQGNTR